MKHFIAFISASLISAMSLPFTAFGDESQMEGGEDVVLQDVFSNEVVTFPAAYEQLSAVGQSGVEYLYTVKASGTGAQFKAGTSGIVTKVNDGALLQSVSVLWGAKANENVAIYTSEYPFTASDGVISGTLVGTVDFAANEEVTFTLPEPARYIGITSTNNAGKACAWESITLTWAEADLPEAPIPDEPEEPVMPETLLINEIMQSNIDNYYFDNEYPDSWVELYNNSDAPIALNGYRIALTNNFDGAYEISGDYIVDARGYIVIACDKEDFGGLHTPFRLESTSKGSVYLFAPDGTLVDSVSHKKMPASNVAYGRVTDAAFEWDYQVNATAGAANTGIVASKVLPDAVFSCTGGVFASPLTLTVSLPEGELPDDVVLAVTTDGREPSLADAVEGGLLEMEIGESTVVRARLISGKALNPVSTTNSYIFHPRATDLTIVSIVTDPDHFYSEDMGILYGEIGDNPNWENNWRRPINIEFFEGSDHVATVNQVCETRLMGGYSRRNAQKSMNVYANKRFGTKRFDSTTFWDDKPEVTETKSFTLRNGGNDFTSLRVRDQLAQAIVGRNYDNVDWMAYRPVLYYVNGEFKGIYDLRERSNEDYVAANYDGLEDIDIVENWWEPDDASFDTWSGLVEPLGKAKTLAEFDDLIDVDNFLSMFTLELFANNTDYLTNNIVCWRSRLDEHPRWRWILKDIDRFGVSYIALDHNYFDFVDEGYAKSQTSQFVHNVFHFFITDPEGSNLFIDRMAFALGDYLQADYILEVYNQMCEEIALEYPYHLGVWFDDAAGAQTDRYYSERKFKNWLTERHDVVYNQMQERFGLGDSYRLVVNRNGYDVTANDVKLCRPVFNGRYYTGRDLTLVASVEPRNNVSWSVVEYDADGEIVSSNTYDGTVLTLNPSQTNLLEVELIVTEPEDEYVAIVGAFNGWDDEANVAIVDPETNCATFVIEGYVNAVDGQGAGIKIKYNDEMFTTEAAIANGMWTSPLYVYDGAPNIDLAAADGKDVTIKFAADTKTALISWETEKYYVFGNLDLNGLVDWTTVNAHLFDAETKAAKTIEMTLDESGVYEFNDVLDFYPTGVVFNNGQWGGANQTVDAEFKANHTYTIVGRNLEDGNDDYGKWLLDKTNGTTGVDMIEAIDADAVYYNLQGLRVVSPANGLYIMVRDGKVTKVIVR